MVSAGLDTVPGNLIMGIASLADLPDIQKRAYDEIMSVYPDNDAWDKCLVEEKSKRTISIPLNDGPDIHLCSSIHHRISKGNPSLLDRHSHLPPSQVH